MTTYVTFQPNTQAPFQFQATLDNNVYNVNVTWNLFGQRYYINVYDLSNNLIVSTPMIGSAPDNEFYQDISLVAPLFTSTLVYRTENNQFEISP